MAGRIILALCCLLCASGFFLAGYLTRISSAPVQFWTGSEEKLKETLQDVPGYNRKMGTAFRLYAAAWLFCDLLGAAYPPAGVLGITALCTLGLYLLYRRYRKIVSDCS